MDKNQIIFLIVTFLFIIGYYYFIYPKYANVAQPQTVTSQNVEVQKEQDQFTNQQIQNAMTPSNLANLEEKSLRSKNDEEKNFELKNDNFIVKLTSNGAGFDQIVLDKGDNLVVSKDKMFFSTDLLNLTDTEINYIQPVYFSAEQKDEKSIVFKKQFIDLAGKECEIVKSIERVDKYKYIISISIRGLQNNIPKIENNISLFSFDDRLGPKQILSNKNNRQEIFYSFAKKYHPIKISKKSYTQIPDFDWINIQNLYYSIIIEKANANNANGITFINQENTQTIYIKANAIDLVDNVYKFNFYTLPKDRKILVSYNKDFDNIVNRFGILNPIVIGFEYLLNWLYSISKSWGISIIILAFIIKALLFPLTRQSTISMKKISQLNPQIKEIQEKYKDNPQKANVEMQALYKREKINPLSGCLPLLLQFPFLIALYNALMYNQGLRGASFLWIKDLSVGDVILNLPFNIPLLGSDIRLLPFIMLITQIGQTIFQSKSQVASTKEQEMQSKLMMWLFPIIFFFVLYNMSSGLILYWTCLNLLSIIETSAISFFEGKKLALAKK